MKTLRFAGVVLSAVVFAGNAAARGDCASADDVATLEVAELQQQLMVAAYTCHDVRAYNRFVLSYRPQLQRSDREMLALFKRKDGSRGFADYNAFKTRLANLSALRSNRDDEFCAEARSEFDAASSHRTTLVRLASEQRPYARLPFSACDGTRVAEADDQDAADVQADDQPTRHHRVVSDNRDNADGAAYDDRDEDAPPPARDDWRSESDDDRDADDDSDDDSHHWWWPF